MSTVKTWAKGFVGRGSLSSIGNVAIVEDDAIVDSFAKAPAPLQWTRTATADRNRL